MRHTLLSLSLVIGSLSAVPAALADNHGSALDDMISPVTNPVNFEDPRAITEVRPLYMYHKADEDFVTGDGNVQLLAAQARFALSDRFAIIATKDGYAWLNPEQNLPDSEGAANLAAGFKYAIHKDEDSIVTGGLRYELASGSPDIFQGVGSGILNQFLSGAIALDAVNLMGFTQLRVPFDGEDSTFWDLGLHADMKLGMFYPLVEFNMVHVVQAGDRIGLEGEGFDVISFGSSGADGSTVVTGAIGARVRVCDSVDLGVAWEKALISRKDIFDWRLTTDVIVRFDI